MKLAIRKSTLQHGRDHRPAVSAKILLKMERRQKGAPRGPRLEHGLMGPKWSAIPQMAHLLQLEFTSILCFTKRDHEALIIITAKVIPRRTRAPLYNTARARAEAS